MIALLSPLFIGMLAIGAIAGFASLTWWYRKSHSVLRKRLPQNLRYMPAHAILDRRRIAFITDSLSPSIERLYHGFESFMLNSTAPLYTIKLFEGEGRTNTTRTQLLDVLSRDYDCIVTTSVFTTQLAQEVTTSTGTLLPIVFGNIPDSEYHIVQHPTAFNHTTGVLTERDIEAEINHVLTLRPGIRRALLLCPTVSRRWLEYQQEHILGALEARGIEVQTIQTGEKTVATIEPTFFDLIIVPPHTLAPGEISLLSQSCNKTKCTLYTTDLDAVAHGAAIGTGGGEILIGTLMAEKAHSVLSRLTSPSHIPITTHVPIAQVRLHKKYLLKQSLSLSDGQLFATECGEIHREHQS